MTERITWDRDGVRHDDPPPRCPNCEAMRREIEQVREDLLKLRMVYRASQ